MLLAVVTLADCSLHLEAPSTGRRAMHRREDPTEVVHAVIMSATHELLRRPDFGPQLCATGFERIPGPNQENRPHSHTAQRCLNSHISCLWQIRCDSLYELLDRYRSVAVLVDLSERFPQPQLKQQQQ